MTDKILEDQFQVLALCRQNKSQLSKDFEKEVKAKYLLNIRNRIKEDKNIHNLLASSSDPMDLKEELCEKLSNEKRDGSEDLFEESVSIILSELKEMRKKDHGLYLVDESTGLPIVPIKEESIFYPPDYIGEDGMTHKGRATVHPSITSSIGLLRTQINKQNRIIEKYKDPVGSHAFIHLTEPEKIVTQAIEESKLQGVVFTENKPKNIELIEIGKEQLGAEFQSVNPSYHRWASYASILKNKILQRYTDSEIWVGKIYRKQNSKYRWYEVEIGISEPFISLLLES